MPKGSPNTQTKATAKYQQKAGYISKGFKLKKEIAEKFRLACEKNGESQASVITRFMESYVNGQQE